MADVREVENGIPKKWQLNPDGTYTEYVSIASGISLSVGDIEIGAVELKDGATDNRGSINASGQLAVADINVSNLSKAEDSVHISGDMGVMALSVRETYPTGLADTDGDYAPLEVDANGDLFTTLGTRLDSTNDSVNIGAAGGVGIQSNGAIGVHNDSSFKSTYSAVATGLAVASSATDIFELVGSASKTVRVLRITVSGTGNPGQYNFAVVKRSSADSGGSSVNTTIVPHDSVNAVATAVAKVYTANPTLGTMVGEVEDTVYFITSGVVTSLPALVFEFGKAQGQEIVLRGVAQTAALNLRGQSIVGSQLRIKFEFTEE